MNTDTDFDLLVLAAFYHPDKQLKDHLKRLLVNAIPNYSSGYSDKEVVNFLSTFPGTVIEPFSLGGVHLDVAAYIVRLALSTQLTRFRVVSPETLGNWGGLVVTDNLKGHYLERYALGKKRAGKTTMEDRFVAPGLMSLCLTDIQTRIQDTVAVCRVGKEGYRIDVENMRWSFTGDTKGILAHLQANSMVLDTKRSLDRMGLRLGYSSGNLTLESVSPEATIQLTALMHSRSVVVLPFETGRIFIRLEFPQDEKQALSVLITQKGQAIADWLAIPEAPSITLSDDIYRSIATWAQPHDAWAHPAFVESLI